MALTDFDTGPNIYSTPRRAPVPWSRRLPAGRIIGAQRRRIVERHGHTLEGLRLTNAWLAPRPSRPGVTQLDQGVDLFANLLASMLTLKLYVAFTVALLLPARERVLPVDELANLGYQTLSPERIPLPAGRKVLPTRRSGE